MNLKQIEKATKIVEELKSLDKSIIELDKMAIKIVNDAKDIKINISCTLPEEDKKENIFDEDGSLKIEPTPTSISWGSIFVYSSTQKVEENKNELSITESLTDISALQLIGVLILDKQNKRKELINQLNKLGANIEL